MLPELIRAAQSSWFAAKAVSSAPTWADVEPVDMDDEVPVEHEPWAIAVLTGELHMGAEEIEGLSETEEAVDLVHTHWARER